MDSILLQVYKDELKRTKCFQDPLHPAKVCTNTSVKSKLKKEWLLQLKIFQARDIQLSPRSRFHGERQNQLQLLFYNQLAQQKLSLLNLISVHVLQVSSCYCDIVDKTKSIGKSLWITQKLIIRVTKQIFLLNNNLLSSSEYSGMMTRWPNCTKSIGGFSFHDFISSFNQGSTCYQTAIPCPC